MQLTCLFVLSISQVLAQPGSILSKRGDLSAHCMPSSKSILIETAVFASELVDCVQINADITVKSKGDKIKLNWPLLKKVKGKFLIEGGNIEDVKLPKLEEVKAEKDAFSFKELSDLKTLSIGSLKKVDGLVFEKINLEMDLKFNGLEADKKLKFKDTKFKSIEGILIDDKEIEIKFEKNPKLKSLKIERTKDYSQVKEIKIEENEALESVEIPGIKEINGEFSVKKNKVLKTFKIADLEKVVGKVKIENDKLVALEIGTYKMKQDDKIKAPVDCTAFKTTHKDFFDVDKCKELVKKNNVLTTTFLPFSLVTSLALALSFL